MQFEYHPDEEDSDEDDNIQQQAMLAQAKYGMMEGQQPMMQQDKKKFDSADHFSSIEQMRKDQQPGDNSAPEAIEEEKKE